MKIAFVNKPMRILPPLQGSMQIWTYEVARRLARYCDVIVYTYSRGSRFRKRSECKEGVRYQFIPRSLDGLLLRLTSRLPRSHNVRRPFYASCFNYLGYALQVAKDLRRQQCDIVHILNYSQFVPIIRTFNPKIKIVLNMRCEWLTQLDRKMIEQRLGHVDLIIGCSKYITEKIRRRFPQFARHCQTNYNGVNINHFISTNDHIASKHNGDKRLLFVGRVSPEKGLHVLLDAFKKVVQRYPQAKLVIVGKKSQLASEYLVDLSDNDKVTNLASFFDGRSLYSYSSHLQEQLRSLKIESNVTFTDHIPHEQLANYYTNADVIINPSFSESFGRSLIEAMAFQVPTVASRVGGMAEIVEDGKTGILVEPGNTNAMAQAMLRLLKDEDLRESMGKAGRERAMKLFSWECVTENLLEKYKNIFRSNILEIT